MRLLFLTAGSHGDIHPFLALASHARAKGHGVMLACNPYFEPLAREHGVPHIADGERIDLKEFIAKNPDTMHHRKGPSAVLKDTVLPMMRDAVSRVLPHAKAFRPDVVVTHPIYFGGPVIAETLGVPWVLANLAPITWFNPRDRSMSLGLSSRRPPLWLTRATLPIARWVLRRALDHGINDLRLELGLAKVRDAFYAMCVGGELNLGLWSPAFRPAKEGDPKSAHVCGFPWLDRAKGHEDDLAELGRFLDGGDAPIVFTLGTAAVHTSGNFYAQAARAATMLGKRAVLLVGRREYESLAGTLPKGVRAFTYAPFSLLFPRASTIVHHGGIGTTAQGLKSGRPTVITPLAHDQFDNAKYCEELGVSVTLHHRHLNAKKLAAALERAISLPGAGEKGSRLRATLSKEDGAKRAIELIEERFLGK